MIVDLATQAYNALRHNRRRSVLTMLGMAWGIATVVLLLLASNGDCGRRFARSAPTWSSSFPAAPSCRLEAQKQEHRFASLSTISTSSAPKSRC